MPLSFADFLARIERANLAPSVHNTQPTRWRLDASGDVSVFEEVGRRLPTADPQGRDAAVSHGSAIEGFVLASADAGVAVDVEILSGAVDAGLRPVARLALRSGGRSDPLEAYVGTRRSYRGAFVERDAPMNLATLRDNGDVALVQTPAGLARLATLHDRGALQTYRDAAYRSELVSWLRLSRRDPRWSLDGLNAEAMEMSCVTAAGASAILAPRVFEALDRIGIGGTLVAEAAVVRSARAVALFHRPADEHPLVTGRRFYRLWLEFERLGVAAAPMSVLADDADICATIAREFDVPGERRLINAFRLGIAPARARAPKARLRRATLVVRT